MKRYLISVLLLTPACAAALDFDGGVRSSAFEGFKNCAQAPAVRPPFPADTGPYLADANSEIIFTWLSADPDANMGLLRAWLEKNGIADNATEFMFHEKYAGARARFAAELGSGAIPVRGTPFPADTGPYLADANSEIIFTWLSGDPDANMGLLRAWLDKNGITEGVTEFMFHKKYAEARARFAAELEPRR